MKTGLGELGPAIRPPRLPAWKGNSSSPPRPFPLAPPLPSSSLSGLAGGDTNRSFRVRPLALFFFFSRPASGVSKLLLGSIASTPRAPMPPPRVKSIRRVVFCWLWRRSWTTGLAPGLRVGLGATPHWAAKSLNFCRVAIFSLLCFSS
ncbi:hypothetical protein EUGRSUZ_G02247 [Eucalyptus grandis]|uniref:Uncharacterized protein n=2 Tax=Eucalyptus grandis TaxID=71139 RepID=A0ACC3K6J6_EUCGR|nr:hypothetical protein EUGRSUZ_G02247 [Eucalyptus grandis]